MEQEILLPETERERKIANFWAKKGAEKSCMSTETRQELEKYITFKRFSWITGVLLTITGAICSVLYSELSSVKGELNAYKAEMFQEINSIKQNTVTTQKDVEWIKKLFESKVVEF